MIFQKIIQKNSPKELQGWHPVLRFQFSSPLLCPALLGHTSSSWRENGWRPLFNPLLSQMQRGLMSATHRPLTSLTEEQNILKETIRKFAQEEISPLVQRMDEREEMAPEIIHSLFQRGLMGIELSEEYGGSGMSFLDSVLVIEEVAKVDPSVAALVDIHNTLVVRALSVYGTEAQKDKYLKKCATDSIGSFCISESGFGSDAFGLRCRAAKEESGWSITGSKQWISNSKEANIFIIFATEDLSKGYKGINAYIVERDTPGLTIGKKHSKLGIRASSTCEIHLNDARISDDQLLGERNRGYQIAIELLNEGRIGIAAQMLGLSCGAFEVAMSYIYERQQFGKRVGDFQGVQFQVAELATDIETSRLLIYNAALLQSSSLPFAKEAAMAKLHASKVAEKVASICVELLGGNGFTRDYPLEKFYRDAKIGSIYEGTNNMQLQTIAKLLEKEHLK